MDPRQVKERESASERRSSAAKVLQMTRTRRNYTVCLPKRRICLEYESAARDKGRPRPESFRRSRHFIRSALRAGPYFTCSPDIDPSFAARNRWGLRGIVLRSANVRRDTMAEGRLASAFLAEASVDARHPGVSAFWQESRAPRNSRERKIEIFIPAVQKRSAVRNYIRLVLLPSRWPMR